MAIYNLGPQDVALLISQALPGNNASVTTGVLDLQAVAPNSDAWRLGRIAVTFPAVPENTSGAGITVALQAAAASLTNSPSAPGNVVPAGFVTPICSQTITIASVGSGGSVATKAYFTMAFDANGSCFQFYQFLITVPSQVTPTGEVITIAWEAD